MHSDTKPLVAVSSTEQHETNTPRSCDAHLPSPHSSAPIPSGRLPVKSSISCDNSHGTRWDHVCCGAMHSEAGPTFTTHRTGTRHASFSVARGSSQPIPAAGAPAMTPPAHVAARHRTLCVSQRRRRRGAQPFTRGAQDSPVPRATAAASRASPPTSPVRSKANGASASKMPGWCGSKSCVVVTA